MKYIFPEYIQKNLVRKTKFKMQQSLWNKLQRIDLIHYSIYLKNY